jgi:hypothetical protein
LIGEMWYHTAEPVRAFTNLVWLVEGDDNARKQACT